MPLLTRYLAHSPILSTFPSYYMLPNPNPTHFSSYPLPILPNPYSTHSPFPHNTYTFILHPIHSFILSTFSIYPLPILPTLPSYLLPVLLTPRSSHSFILPTPSSYPLLHPTHSIISSPASSHFLPQKQQVCTS